MLHFLTIFNVTFLKHFKFYISKRHQILAIGEKPGKLVGLSQSCFVNGGAWTWGPLKLNKIYQVLFHKSSSDMLKSKKEGVGGISNKVLWDVRVVRVNYF